MPAISFEAGQPVFGKRNIRAALNGNMIVVIQINQLAQFQMTGQGSGLVRNSFHQIPVTDDGIGKMIHNGKLRAVKPGGQKTFGHGHTHAIGKALSQGSGGGFHSRGMPVFGVSGGFTSPLSEVLQILQGKVITGEMKQTIEQHRTMPGGKDKPVPIRPFRIPGIMFQKPGPQDIGHRGRTHGHARMPGIGLLDRIHSQHANSIDTKIIQKV